MQKTYKRSAEEWAAYRAWLKKPVEAVKDWFGVTPDDWQGDFLNAIFQEGQERNVAKSAHGVGKTAVDAWAGWIFLNCYENSRVVATAPVQAQLQDVLFPEFGLWHSKMPSKMRDEWQISAQHIRHKSNPNVWFAVARTSNKPANLQGFHNTNIAILADEGSAIPEPVYEVIEGTLSEAGEEGRVARLIVNGNPNFTSGEMFNAFGRNKDLYNRFTITGDPEWFATLGIPQGGFHEDHGRVYYSKRVRAKYVANMASKYGRDSAVFDVRVKGIFPRVSDDCVIPWAWAQAATMIELPHFDAVANMVTLVVDPARAGHAETVIGFFRQGICYKINAYKTKTTTEALKYIQECVLEVVKAELRLSTIIIDEPGIGGGVIDQAQAVGLPVTPYNGSLPMVRDQDPDEDIRMFENRRARDWWNVRLMLEQNRLPLPNDETLIAQLTSVKYRYNSREKIVIESKQDLKDRLGKDASPDRADVIVMGTAPAYSPAARHATIQGDDWYPGEDRPSMEMDL